MKLKPFARCGWPVAALRGVPLAPWLVRRPVVWLAEPSVRSAPRIPLRRPNAPAVSSRALTGRVGSQASHLSQEFDEQQALSVGQYACCLAVDERGNGRALRLKC